MTTKPARSFLDALAAGPLLFDGAMGSLLYERGVLHTRSYDELVLSNPDLIRRVHHDYLHAGAQVIETNTFGANRIKLTHYGLEAQVRDINMAAAKLARAAAGEKALVAGAVGPLGVRLEPYGPTSLEEARDAFGEQMKALKEAGVDIFILETFADLHEIQQAILAARDVSPGTPIVAQMTVGEDCHTP